MSQRISRRQALRRLATTGAMVGAHGSSALTAAEPEGADRDDGAILVAGQPAELSITPVTPHTLRVSFLPLRADGTSKHVDEDLVLVKREWPPAAVSLRSRKQTAELDWN